jgi:hypothetical protein
MHIYIYVYMYICIYVYVYVYICMYIYIYIYTYVYTKHYVYLHMYTRVLPDIECKALLSSLGSSSPVFLDKNKFSAYYKQTVMCCSDYARLYQWLGGIQGHSYIQELIHTP